MANPLENVRKLGGVHLAVLAHLTKEKKLELKQINSVKKQRRKEVTVSDRTLASVRPMCPVSDSSWLRFRSSDRMQHSKGDWTCRACVRSQVTYGDVGGAGVGARVQELIRRWCASGRARVDASGRKIEAQGALWK